MTIQRARGLLAKGLLIFGLNFDLAHALPEEHSDSVHSGKIAFANGRYVEVGHGAIVRTSMDDKIWTERSSGTRSSLHAITHGNGLFVAVGNEGALVTSPDGILWTVRESGTDERLRGIVFGDGIFVAVGYAGTIIISKDGARWRQCASGTQERLQTVFYRTGTFIATGKQGVLLRSKNGRRWEKQNCGSSSNQQANLTSRQKPLNVTAPSRIVRRALWPFGASGLERL